MAVQKQGAARNRNLNDSSRARGISRAPRVLAALILVCFGAFGCRPKKPPAPKPPEILVFKGRGFTVPLPQGFTGMDAEQTRVFSALGGADVETYTANSEPLILEVHAITPDGDPREIFGAVRNADYSDFLPGRYKADVRLIVAPRRAPDEDAARDRDAAMARLARLLVTPDAAHAVRDILGPALPPEQAQGLERRIVVRADEAESALTITISGDDPDQCRAIAGAYVRFLQSRNGRYMDHVIAFLDDRIASNKKNLAWYDKNIAYYKKDLKVRDPGAPPDQVDLLINALDLDRAGAEADLITAHAQLFEARRLAPGAPDPPPEELLKQYAGATSQPPPDTVTRKTESAPGRTAPELTPAERVNLDLASIELERRVLMAGRTDTPPEAKKLADAMAARTRELEKIIRKQVEKRFDEKQPGEPATSAGPANNAATPEGRGAATENRADAQSTDTPPAPPPGSPKMTPELREKLIALEITFALEKARFDRLDLNAREYKKNRDLAYGLEQELVRLVRERETQKAIGEMLNARLRALRAMAASSPDKAEVRDPVTVAAKPALPRGAGLPPVFAHLQGGVVIDKKEPATLGGRAAVVMRCTMPWSTGRDVFTYQALIPAGDKLYWLRAIAVRNNALDDPGVVRFFKDFIIKE